MLTAVRDDRGRPIFGLRSIELVVPIFCSRILENSLGSHINELTFNTTYAKYVDDTTVFSVSLDLNDCTLQSSADFLVPWTQHNTMAIITNKTKELIS